MPGPWFISLNTTFVLVSPVYSNWRLSIYLSGSTVLVWSYKAIIKQLMLSAGLNTRSNRTCLKILLALSSHSLIIRGYSLSLLSTAGPSNGPVFCKEDKTRKWAIIPAFQCSTSAVLLTGKSCECVHQGCHGIVSHSSGNSMWSPDPSESTMKTLFVCCCCTLPENILAPDSTA